MFGTGKETGRLLDKLFIALVRDSRICYQQPRGWISRLLFGWRSIISCTSPGDPLRTRRFAKLLPKTVRSTAKTCCLLRKASSSVFISFFWRGNVVRYCGIQADHFSSSRRLTTRSRVFFFVLLFRGVSKQLGADTSCLKPPASLSVKATYWLSNEKRSVFEVGKMDELDFGAEIWAIQLPRKT